MKVPYDRCFNMSGVIWPTMKLLIQLDDAPRAMPYALLLNGQTSEMMTQAQGPQPTRLERGLDCTTGPLVRTLTVTKVDDENPPVQSSDKLSLPPQVRLGHLHECNSSPACGFLSGPLVLILCEDDRDDHVAEAHTNPASNHHRLSTQFVDVEDGGNGGDEHGDTDNACREQAGCVATCAQGLEDGRGVVENWGPLSRNTGYAG